MNRIHFYFFFIAIGSLFPKTPLSAQIDAQFTAHSFTRQMVNPASVGEKDIANAFINWRTQWGNKGPVTYTSYFDTPLKIGKRIHGVGISLMNDEAGLFKTTMINFAYSHKQNLWDGVLSVGTQASFLNFIFDGTGVDNLDYSDYHSYLKTNYPSFSTEMSGVKFDMALGLHFSNKNQYYGISLNHLTRPTLEINATGAYVFFNRNLNIYGGYTFRLRALPEIKIEPNAYLRTDGKLTQIDISCNAWYKENFFAGLNYRFQDAISVVGGLRLSNGILIGGAYDITTSRMAFGGFGSAEVFLNYEFSLSLKSKTNKYKSIRIL